MMKSVKAVWFAAPLLVACAGSDGLDGTQGVQGKSGKSAVLESREADEDERPVGYVLNVGVGKDTDELVVCHGEPGPKGGFKCKQLRCKRLP